MGKERATTQKVWDKKNQKKLGGLQKECSKHVSARRSAVKTSPTAVTYNTATNFLKKLTGGVAGKIWEVEKPGVVKGISCKLRAFPAKEKNVKGNKFTIGNQTSITKCPNLVTRSHSRLKRWQKKRKKKGIER